MSTLIYQPDTATIHGSNLYHYMEWLDTHRALKFADYEALWKWSVDDIDSFWSSLLDYFEITYQGSFDKIRSQSEMPGIQWFEGISLNYAYHLSRSKTKDQLALVACNESSQYIELTWESVLKQAAQIQEIFNFYGLQPGDRVAGYLPNIPAASISLFASIASGLVWSSCSPDFGSSSVIDRFSQIGPKVLIAVDQYRYGGKSFDRNKDLHEIIRALPTLKVCILIKPNIDVAYQYPGVACIDWDEITAPFDDKGLVYRPMPFNHPMWILYSSGTTGLPKAITHSQGGMLLEHLKYTHFHNNVKTNERFLWYTTTGWMMWNYLHATWLSGAIPVLYDGHPTYPDSMQLWRLAKDLNINHFGTSAPFLHASIKDGLNLPQLSDLKSLSSTGSPLNDEVYGWLYKQINHDFYLWSMSGGTDMCTAFVGGCPIWPIYSGEIQCRALGCDLKVLDPSGIELKDEVGELVIAQPMPCMPIYFWNDSEMNKYKESYFSEYPGLWRHGDWITLTIHHGLIISGRSDTTLKRFGVRIGTSEIYAALLYIHQIDDALIIHYDDKDGKSFMPMFVKLKAGIYLDDLLVSEIKQTIKTKCSPRHLPDQIIQVQDIPYTLSGKKMEAPVKKIFMGKKISEVVTPGTMRNPASLEEFETIFHQNLK